MGNHDKHSEIRTYSLDRIISLKENRSAKFTDSGFDAKKYYENVIGVSVTDEDPVEIEIAYSALQAQYVITQPPHPSQKLITEAENRYVFRYFLIPNFEFYAQILGWGTEVEILKPERLRKKMKELAANYTN